MRDDISYYQKKLRLSKSLVEIYDSISYDNKDQFMHDLLKTLYEERMVNIIERNVKASRFPNLKTFDDFSYKDITFPERFTPEIMESLDFIDKKENLIFYGRIGSGKTHLALALGLSALRQQKQVVFYTLHDLVNTLVKAKESHQFDRFMAKLLKNDLIILDEWGYLPLHQEGARLLFEVIGKCYEQKSLIITTNMEFSHWKNFLFDEKLTIAILDRIIHYSNLVIFDRDSWRKERALMK